MQGSESELSANGTMGFQLVVRLVYELDSIELLEEKRAPEWMVLVSVREWAGVLSEAL